MLLSHTTALAVIRAQETRRTLEGQRRCDACVPGAAPSASDLEALLASAPFLSRLDAPIEVLVAATKGRSRIPGIASHVMSHPLLHNAAFEVAPGIRSVGPELLAVLMAPKLTELELIVLLSELLGTYAIAPQLEDGMITRRSPITTPERIAEFLDALGTYRGVAQVRRALGKACVRSASPRETKLSLRLGLKPQQGGQNFDVLSMNEPLEVVRIGNKMRKGVRKPDILLRAPGGATRGRRPLLGAAVEYDGRDHGTEEGHARDVGRHNEVTAIGLVEYVVTKKQYGDLEYMDGLADLIRRDLGLPRQRLTRAEAARRKRLRQELYEELEHIDGEHWDGLERQRARLAGEKNEGPGFNDDWDVVPVEAYGLD
ncbi:hypothetical protein [Thermophilibacter provencensis]|uniref:Uncharacterized protein n=1 Tax=Thermophilibacter provencensis TaxID=1852386 RepID=A0ABT7V4R0_9ACTN|nr:hypothetical protein [Thermophilibacter provencensis]MDM8271589.1 hypothetical protein [Thermophilibacter provencensis]